MKEQFDLCDTRKLSNLDVNKFNFRQKHGSSFIQGRLDYLLISNSLEDVITHANFFAPLSTDHSPVTISISKSNTRIHGHGFWNSTVLCFQTKIISETGRK